MNVNLEDGQHYAFALCVRAHCAVLLGELNRGRTRSATRGPRLIIVICRHARLHADWTGYLFAEG